MSQLHNAEAGNMSISGDQAGATGGQGVEGPPPPPHKSADLVFQQKIQLM